MPQSKHVLLVAGGWSPERQVSLNGAEAIAHALKQRGHSVTLFDLSEGFSALLAQTGKHDIAFLNLHGAPGEDGLVQAMLDRTGLPYQGSGPAASLLALNKSAAKAIFQASGLLTPDWIFLPKPPESDWRPSLPYPLFIKPNTGGSSLHTYKINDFSALQSAMNELFANSCEVLIEKMIQGREVTCGVLENRQSGQTEALPPILILPKGEFFDYRNKYAADGAAELCPAPLPQDCLNRVRQLSVKAHHALGLRGYSRADFILTEDGELYLLEVNTLPGMTATSLVPREAAATGLEFGEFLEMLLETSST